jgi:hypothetical protein
VALFLVLALSALATSLLVLTRSERLAERGGLAYLHNRIRSEAGLRMPNSGLGVAAEQEWIGLGSGFELGRVLTEQALPAPMAVRWRMDPDSVASSFPGALEVGATPPETGVELLDPTCDSGLERPLVRTRSLDGFTPSIPPVPPQPRVGILGIDRLLELTTTELPSLVSGPGLEAPGILRAPSGVRLVGGARTGVLISPGDVSLASDATFRGLMILAGDLALSGNARVEGVVLAGGSASITDHARLLGCVAIASTALRHPNLARAHPIPGGGRLGRF